MHSRVRNGEETSVEVQDYHIIAPPPPLSPHIHTGAVSPEQRAPSSSPSASPSWPAERSELPVYPRQPSGPSHGPCSSRPHLGRGAHEPLRLVGEGHMIH